MLLTMLDKNVAICTFVLSSVAFLISNVEAASIVTSSYSMLLDIPEVTCTDTSLEQKNSAASIILTGTVHNCIKDSTLSYSCNLQIWRVMKGSDLISSNQTPATHKKKPTIEVHGDINSPICDAVVSNDDTRIFFLTMRNQRVVLEGCARITLKNLENTEAVIVGEKIVEQKKVRHPCFNMICAYGAYCNASEDNSTAACHCPEYQCNGTETSSSSLCGSDGITYLSDCYRAEAQCYKQLKIRTQPMKECDSTIDDDSLCDEKVCPTNQECVIIDGRHGMSSQALCRCLRCDHVKSSSPVCGSDQKTYFSECHLNRESCLSGESISVLRQSKCDPCETYKKISGTFESPCQGICSLSNEGTPVCCDDIECSSEEGEVCADDGNTYTSTCSMHKRSCRTGRHLTVVNSGACPERKDFTVVRGSIAFDSKNTMDESAIESLEEFVNEKLIEQNEGDIDGKILKDFIVYDARSGTLLYRAQMSLVEVAVKPDDLPEDDYQWAYNRLHSADTGVVNVYARENQLQFAVGQHPHDDFFMEDVCLDRQCTNGARCHLLSTLFAGYQADCQCDDASESDRLPVSHGCKLASDGTNTEIHVQNQQDVRSTMCLSGSVLTIQDICMVETCETFSTDNSCEFGSRCEIENGSPTCSCKHFQCEDDEVDPVCGSDGVSYNTQCHMDLSSCTKQIYINITYRGNCDEFEYGSGDNDEEDDDEDTEGSGGCDCDFGASCQSTIDDEDETCVCDFDCSAQMGHVCGSDGVTYTSECHLQLAQCNKQEAISVVHQSPCKAVCDCNEYGSVDDKECHHITGQCTCKPGVGGIKCDACIPGYWNFRALGDEFDVADGCQECGCNEHGSTRQDCDQMTGKCDCIAGVTTGLKCNICINDRSTVTESKCQHENVPSATTSVPSMDETTAAIVDETSAAAAVQHTTPLPDGMLQGTPQPQQTTPSTPDIEEEEVTGAVVSTPSPAEETTGAVVGETTAAELTTTSVAATTTTTTEPVPSTTIDDDSETSGDRECENGDDEDCIFPSSGDGQDGEDTQTPSGLAETTSTSTHAQSPTTPPQVPDAFFSGKLTYAKTNSFGMEYDKALKDPESDLYKNYTAAIERKIKEVNQLEEAWQVAVVVVDSFEEKSSWSSWFGGGQQLQANIDLKLVTLDQLTGPPSASELTTALNALEGDIEFDISDESGTLVQ